MCTCKSLGCPIDVEFDCKTSRLTALIVPGPGRFCSFFGRESEYIIPWECICQIGEDIILVKSRRTNASTKNGNLSYNKVFTLKARRLL